MNRWMNRWMDRWMDRWVLLFRPLVVSLPPVSSKYLWLIIMHLFLVCFGFVFPFSLAIFISFHIYLYIINYYSYSCFLVSYVKLFDLVVSTSEKQPAWTCELSTNAQNHTDVNSPTKCNKTNSLPTTW